MVEEDSVGRVHPVRLAVVPRDPVAEDLGDAVRAPWVERRRLRLRRLDDLAEHLARPCFVEAAPHALLADRVEQPQRAHAGRVRGELRNLEADLDVTLGAEVVDLVRLDRAHEPVEDGAVGQISEDELDLTEDVVDPRRIERARPPDHPVHLVVLLEQNLREVRAVLAGDAGDESLALGHGALPYRPGRLRFAACARS